MDSIKNWALEDRPREKLMLNGARALSQAELLAIVIGSGTQKISAIDLSRMILKQSGNDLKELGKKTAQELQKINGVGPAKAVTIQAVMELSRRRAAQSNGQVERINSSRDAYMRIRSSFEDLAHEEFHVIYLNRANSIVGVEQISKGGISGTVADGKVIYRKALIHQASAMILSHNHPSGQLKPSQADLKLTRSLISFGKMIDIQILDHLIITNDNYFSFADEGLMTG